MKQKLVIIGNGMAGARLIEDVLRREGNARFEISLFGEEARGNYNRILLSDVLNGSRTQQSILLNPREWYESNGVRFHCGERAVQIDRENRVVIGENGSREPFDVLVLATGSRPFVPPMEGLKTEDGNPKSGVFVMRTLDDCERIAAFATKAPRAAVIGGGLLGLEAARGLMQHGAEVHLIHNSSRLMNAQLDKTAAQMLKTSVEQMGIWVHLNKQTTEVKGEDSVAGLRFKDGEELGCDMVVVACGIRPNIELAIDCGLPVERAVVVDDQLCSIPEEKIYAVGEVAQHRGRVYGLVAPLWEQARVLAEVLSGKNPDAKYQGSKLATKLKIMGIDLASMGAPEAQEGDEVVEYREPRRGRYKKLIIRENRLAGAILLGEAGTAATLMQAFDRGQALPEDRAALLWKIGKATTGVAEMPDDAPICQCNGVAAGAIRACVAAGLGVSGIMAQTRAGTGCGSCKSVLGQFVGK